MRALDDANLILNPWAFGRGGDRLKWGFHSKACLSTFVHSGAKVEAMSTLRRPEPSGAVGSGFDFLARNRSAYRVWVPKLKVWVALRLEVILQSAINQFLHTCANSFVSITSNCWASWIVPGIMEGQWTTGFDILICKSFLCVWVSNKVSSFVIHFKTHWSCTVGSIEAKWSEWTQWQVVFKMFQN